VRYRVLPEEAWEESIRTLAYERRDDAKAQRRMRATVPTSLAPSGHRKREKAELRV